MKSKLKNIGFYFVASSELSNLRAIQQVELAIKAGVKVVQFREKDLDRKQMHETAAKIRELTKKAKVLFIVNDYLDVAIKAEADGVHLGKNDFDPEEVRKIMPDILVGLSARSVEEAVLAEKKGADYIYFGPIFKSNKKEINVLSVDAIKEVKEKVKIPIIAIGGISKDNVKEVLNAGADGFVIVSELFKKDLGKEINQIINIS
ncbi:thiamine phosphate synthase [Candidatus Woesearchaeota archaeon]|jgi:thiamine-phosphate pyrophosphorylase|nr:thiamine phosphate synthase [Candidatus Woesearchaeota archaeon]